MNHFASGVSSAVARNAEQVMRYDLNIENSILMFVSFLFYTVLLVGIVW